MTTPTSIQPTHPDNFAKLKCPISTIICREKTIIIGDVTIGSDCVIHPTTNIIARNGPIVIGNNNLIEERVSIVNNRPEPMIIGDQNVFEVDSQCESPKVGNNNILECKSFVGPNIVLTDNCIIGAGCRLLTDQDGAKLDTFESNTVVSGQSLNRRIVKELPASSHNSQLDFLRKILPNYQKLWRPANLPATPPTQR